MMEVKGLWTFQIDFKTQKGAKGGINHKPGFISNKGKMKADR